MFREIIKKIIKLYKNKFYQIKKKFQFLANKFIRNKHSRSILFNKSNTFDPQANLIHQKRILPDALDHCYKYS
ncbi:hypothetical protein BpHYR1_046014 [Brachionus plicatilis]|uniref:Uncharacterized protein n=1 Tax=Brachionus plicatilis TaxID=10195 RepID=A0A3M7Q0S6_BRAPC|nr:hypothetical protein BpHYR1_046014 [Brachionus plicatilis]